MFHAKNNMFLFICSLTRFWGDEVVLILSGIAHKTCGWGQFTVKKTCRRGSYLLNLKL